MADRETVRRGYDELAEAYAANRSGDERERAILDAFLDSLADPTRVLDAGCGHGEPVLRRLSEGATAVGLDFAAGQLRLAADGVPAARLVQGDMTDLPFRADAFDAVTAVDSLIHVPLPDHQAVVDEFARVLRPGGRVLLSEAPAEFERTNPDWLGDGVEMTWHMAGAEATRDQLRAAGFRVESEWAAPETAADEPPKPPFFAAVLDR
ncbi:class I SAM-dependent methyltransferase [Halostella salina]|uniref:class I SAM-dependent methyltransferase n=1 Tax=Halostella salina TaxID=1547897 RepID=UPI000EF7CE2E|nr:class I SAM-dependent methyltransferase [Halostella salina]